MVETQTTQATQRSAFAPDDYATRFLVKFFSPPPSLAPPGFFHLFIVILKLFLAQWFFDLRSKLGFVEGWALLFPEANACLDRREDTVGVERVLDILGDASAQVLEHLHEVNKHLQFWQIRAQVIQSDWYL